MVFQRLSQHLVKMLQSKPQAPLQLFMVRVTCSLPRPVYTADIQILLISFCLSVSPHADIGDYRNSSRPMTICSCARAPRASELSQVKAIYRPLLGHGTRLLVKVKKALGMQGILYVLTRAYAPALLRPRPISLRSNPPRTLVYPSM